MNLVRLDVKWVLDKSSPPSHRCCKVQEAILNPSGTLETGGSGITPTIATTAQHATLAHS